MNKFKNKKNKIFFFSLFSIIIIISGITVFVWSPLSPIDLSGQEEIYITGDDVIKNFRFDSFDDSPISLGGITSEHDDRLKFEVGGIWEAHEDDIAVQSITESNDTIYVYYRVTLTNKINMYTNVRLDDASENIAYTTENLLAGSYEHQGLYGDRFFGWDSYYKWYHYNFGDITAYNAKNNQFAGELVMSFDINEQPLPAVITDDEGNEVEQEFAYIGVSSIYIGEQDHGKLSDDVPTITGLTPAVYDTDKRDALAGGAVGSRMKESDSVKVNWNPDASLSTPTIKQSFDLGVQPQSEGSSMVPTTKDGNAIWDAKTREQSMINCEFRYQLGSLSPIVQSYQRTLSWYRQNMHTRDCYDFWKGGYYVKFTEGTATRQSATRDVALHVTNRYIQSEIKIVFNVWSAWKISEQDLGDYNGLDLPQEYYDDLIWSTTVDGFGGGTQETSGVGLGGVSDLVDGVFGVLGGIFGGFSGIITIIIIIMIIAIASYLFIKIGVPYINSRMRRKEHDYNQKN